MIINSTLGSSSAELSCFVALDGGRVLFNMENDLVDGKVKKMRKVVWIKKEGYSEPIIARSVLHVCDFVVKLFRK